MFDKNKFKAQLALTGMTLRELAGKLGINESTLYRKINSGGNFTREEISRIVLILNIDNPLDIFFT